MANDGFVVPNAPDASVFDQAEPDSLDFFVVGNRRSGVVEGGIVTPNNSTTVNVSTVSVISNGIAGTAAGAPVVVPAADSANARFDVVVARRNIYDNTFGVITLQGPTNLNTNPRFVSVGTAATQFNPDTDVLLAAIYRAPGTSVQAGDIVDKRVFYGTIVTRKGADVPTPGVGREGEVYYRTAGPRQAGQSSFWVRDDTGWQNLTEFDPSMFLPIGTVINYAGKATKAPNPDYYLPCLQQYVSIAAYPELYEEIGDTFGPIQGGSFPLPPSDGRYTRGGTTAGAGGGRSSFKMAANNMPRMSLSGTTGAVSPGTSEDVRPPLAHTVGGVTKNHGHVMEHQHVGVLFAYPYGSYANPATGGNTRGYYHLNEGLCSGSHGVAGIHVGVYGGGWNAAQHGLDWIWEEYLDASTREYTAGIHAGSVPNNYPVGGESFDSGDHQHVVNAHPERRHSHVVASHSHPITLSAIGEVDPASINLDPTYVVYRQFIKYR